MKINSKIVDKLNETMPWLRYTGNVLHTVTTQYGQTVQVLEYEDLSETYANDPDYREWENNRKKRQDIYSKALEKNYVDKYWVDYSLGGSGTVFYMGSKGQRNITPKQRQHLRQRFGNAPFNASYFRKLIAELTLLSVVDSNVAIYESKAMANRTGNEPQDPYTPKEYMKHLVAQIKQDRCDWCQARNGEDMILEHSLRIRIAGYEKLSEVLQDILLSD